MKWGGVLLIILLGVSEVSATPGRTDQYGCHNSKTEGYHCHGPQSASSSSASSPQTSSSSFSISQQSQGSKVEGLDCSQNWECLSNFCVHSVCRNSAYHTGDGFCDSGESCINSPKDCGSCENNQKCETEIGEDCFTSNDCPCGSNQWCAAVSDRPNKQDNGCYVIQCGDGYADEGETSDTCCLDVPCEPSKSLISEISCDSSKKSCQKKTKDWVKISVGVIIIVFGLIIYNRVQLKKTHRQ
jgi:hypothetical protein